MLEKCSPAAHISPSLFVSAVGLLAAEIQPLDAAIAKKSARRVIDSQVPLPLNFFVITEDMILAAILCWKQIIGVGFVPQFPERFPNNTLELAFD